MKLERVPYWPMMLKRNQAAAYLSLSPAEFETEVNEGRLPMPVKLGKSEHWSRLKLDEAVEALHGGVPDWETRAGLKVA